MKIEIEIPEELWEEQRDMIEQFKGNHRAYFFNCCFLLGLLVPRKSGNMNQWKENFDRLLKGQAPIFGDGKDFFVE